MAVQNAENGVVWGGYGALEVNGNVTYSTLIETMCLSFTVFEIAGYLSKVVHFDPQHLHLAPS